MDERPSSHREGMPWPRRSSHEPYCRKRKPRSSTPIGAPPTICPSARSICSTIRLLREPLEEEHIKPRLLGHWGTTPGLNFIYVHLNRLIKKARSRHDLHRRPGPWRAGDGRQHLSRRNLQRGLSGHFAGRGGHEAALHAVLVSRRHSKPRGARDARLDPRGRRARLCAFACLRRGFRQSRPDRRLRRRRRRGRDGAARHELAFQQVPQSGARRRRAADPASQRLQDRQSDSAGAHSARGARLISCAATAMRPISSRATTRRRCTS